MERTLAPGCDEIIIIIIVNSDILGEKKYLHIYSLILSSVFHSLFRPFRFLAFVLPPFGGYRAAAGN